MAVTTLPERTSPLRRRVVAAPTRADRAFQALVVGSAWTVLAILGLITVFLLIQAWPAFDAVGWSFLTRFEWFPDNDPPVFGVGALLAGTLIIAAIGLTIALPVAIGSALYVNEYAPRWAQRGLVMMIDLLAAIPSLIYGMWGLYWLSPKLEGVTRWLADHLGFIPLFKAETFGFSMFICGVVVALMILPIIASVSREVFAQVPRTTCEGALALGGTRWGMIRRVVLPFGRSGIIGAAMLGLGRALGETIAVVLILSINFTVTSHILEPGGGSVAAHIANRFPEAAPLDRDGLIAAGLVLFGVTLVVNMAARVVVNRARSLRGLDG